MNKNKKNARPDVGASERAKEPGQASRQGRASIHNDTTSPSPGQRVSDYLLPGQQNAVPLKYLKDLLHLDGRKVRLMIRAERLAGTPICEDSQSGYYLPKSTNERDLCAKRLRHRAAQIIKVADAIAAATIEREGTSD